MPFKKQEQGLWLTLRKGNNCALLSHLKCNLKKSCRVFGINKASLMGSLDNQTGMDIKLQVLKKPFKLFKS